MVKGKQTTRKARGIVCAYDRARDLALLKINLRRPDKFTSIPISTKDPKVGSKAIVIGNPGLGDQVLEQTVTEGIISSVNRVIGEQGYYQTSAAVNPGSSGGPLLADDGSVVGMVTLKANIEAAGFAITRKDIIDFLVRSTSTANESLGLLRTWTDASGEFSIRATLIQIDASRITLKRESGSKITVEIAKLSPDDQHLLSLIKALSKPQN